MPLKDYRDELVAELTKAVDEVISLSERIGACEADIRVPMHVHLTSSGMALDFEPIWEVKSKNYRVGSELFDKCAAGNLGKPNG